MRAALVFPRFRYVSGDPPLGAAYLAAALRAEGAGEVEVLDTTFGPGPREAARRLVKGEYDLVAFSAMTTMLRDAAGLAREVKAARPRTLTLLGGPHATAVPEDALKAGPFDGVALGEGEATFAEAVRRGTLEGIAGIWTRENGAIRRGPDREPAADLDALPFPDLSDLDMPAYLAAFDQMDAAGGRDLAGTSIIAGRGCPFRCSFCQPTLDRLFGRRLRLRSPGNIVAELEGLVRRYGVRTFLFRDDTLTVDREWVLALCRALEDSGLGLVWGANVRSGFDDPEVLRALWSAGCRKLLVGIESGSDRVLGEIYNKGTTTEGARRTVLAAKGAGFKVLGFFMVGAPGETEAEVRATLRLARRLPLDEAAFSATTPLPGTTLYDRTAADVARPYEEFDYYRRYVYSGRSGLPPWKVDLYRRLGYLSFYLDPRRLPRVLSYFGSPSGVRKLARKLERL